MSQKTITSFFGKPKAANKSEVEQKKSDEKAPSKLTNNDGKLIANLDKKKATEKLDDKSVSQIVEATEPEDSPIKAAPKRKSKAISSDEGSGDEAKSEPLKVKKPLKTYSNGKSKSKKNKITDEKTKDLFPESEARSDSKTKKSKIKEERAKQPSPEPESKPESKPKKGEVKEENVKEPSPEPESKPESKLTKDGSVDDGAKTAVKTDAKSMLVTVEIAEYNPSKAGYHPVKDACWKHGEKVPYLALAKTLELIEATSSRLKMIEILANFLRSVIMLSPTDLLQSIYLCLNQLAPAYVGLELGVGDTILMKALAQATGRSVDKIKADAAAKGDLGLVAEASKGTQRIMFQPAPLTVKTVFDKLKDIAAMTGTASQGKKVDKIQSLLVACRLTEARYIIRSLAGKLRIGLAEQSVLQAIAQACTLTPPNQPYPPETLNSGKGLSADALKAKIDENAMLIKTAYCQCPSYDRIVPVLLEHGVAALPSHCSLTPGVPLKPMLACPTRGVSEVLQRFDNADFTCEWKYDGERAQIHLTEDGAVHIYSRNQEDNTSKYPDVINRFKTCLQPTVKSCIIDSEAVAWDREKKQLLPFQILSTRKRKDANEAEIKVQVCIFAFDMLYLNGEALVREPLKRRRELLHQSLKEVEGEFQYATGKDPKTTEEIEEFLDESLKGHCEGLMVKALEKHATYEIARRSHNWLKLKKDYLEGVGDTIDAVVIGGYLGTGKRTGNYGGFLLACYDNENEEFQSLCKIGTGFSDEDFANHAKFFKDHLAASPKSYYRFDPSLAPDHWFEPVQVWEVKCADLSISPVHHAAVGIVHPEKGISLRFPRFLRIREDKNPEDATSAQQIADLYNNQEQIKNSGDFAKGMDEEEGFY